MTLTLERPDTRLGPEPLYQIALGFAATKVLLVAQRLGVFELLTAPGKTAVEVAAQHRLHPRGTEMLLDACVSLRLCRKEGASYTATPLSDQFLIPGKPGYLGRFFDHFNDHMYPAWLHLEEAVRTGHAQVTQLLGEKGDHFFKAIDQDTADLETFMLTMEEHSAMEGDALARTYDFSPHHQLLDVGGGTGRMSVSILKAFPHLRAIVFDRPPVCAIAQRKIREHGLADRIQVHAGSFFSDPLPPGADIALLSGILHNWSEENARKILVQCAQALPKNGTLLISEQVLNEEKTEPLPAALCSLNMLLMMEGAQEYSRSEFETMLDASGFSLQEVRPTGGVRQLLVARRL